MTEKTKTALIVISLAIAVLSACAASFLFRLIYEEPIFYLPSHSVDIRIEAIEHGYALTEEQLYTLENGSYEEIIELTAYLFGLWGKNTA